MRSIFFILPVQEFIEEILSAPFGGMIAFVKEAEALVEKGQLERLRSDEGERSLLVVLPGDAGERSAVF